MVEVQAPQVTGVRRRGLYRREPVRCLIVGCYEGGKLKYVGKVRAGFVPHQRCAMMPLLKELATDGCPFVDLPEKRRTLHSVTKEDMEKCRWVKPMLVAQINFQEWTPDGHLRHASFAGLRTDKDPLRVTPD